MTGDTALAEVVALYRDSARRHRKNALIRRVAGDEQGRMEEQTAVHILERAARAERHPDIDRVTE